METGRTHKTGTVMKTAALLASAALFLAAGAYLWNAMGGGKEQPMETAAEPGFSTTAMVGALPDKTEDEIRAMLQQQMDDTQIAFSINAHPVFADGEAMGDLKLESPANNINNIRFRIVRDDTGEQVYDSGILQPNHYILEDRLQTKEPLEKGDHACTANIYLLDHDTQEEMGHVQAGLTITVEK